MATRKKDSGAASPFREGFDARMGNRSIASCPYTGDAALVWRQGFAAACQHMDAPVPGYGPDEGARDEVDAQRIMNAEAGVIMPKARPK